MFDVFDMIEFCLQKAFDRVTHQMIWNTHELEVKVPAYISNELYNNNFN